MNEAYDPEHPDPDPEHYPGEALDTALMLLRLDYEPDEVIEALQRNFPADLNLQLVVHRATAILRQAR